MLRLALLCLLAFCLTATEADAQKNCRKGKPCGNTCIARDKVCRIDGGAAPPPSQPGVDAEAPAVETAPWVASSRGSVYYARECAAAGKLAPQNRVYFRSEKEAQDAGYTRSRSKGC